MSPQFRLPATFQVKDSLPIMVIKTEIFEELFYIARETLDIVDLDRKFRCRTLRSSPP